MDSKKILIVANGFYPQQTPRSFRATELAKEFCRQGHSVTVMAPHKENVQQLLDEYPIQYWNLGMLNWKLPNINGVGKAVQLYNKVVNRLLPLVFEYPRMELFFKVKRKLKMEKSKFDVIISIAVPHTIHWGVAASWSSRENENIAPIWIADCGDPYYFQENDTFQPPFYFKWIEKWFMRKANYITVPTDTSYRGYFPEFHSKLEIIPQGFRFEDVKRTPTAKDGIIRFGYGGTFTLHRRDPREFLDYLTKLDKSYRFEFHIFTINPNFVESYASKDPRIRLHPPSSRLAMLEVLSAFDFVVNLSNFGTAQTPSKLIDYAIIEKPVLQIDSTNFNEDIFLEFLEGNYKNQLPIENPNQYRIEEVTRKFLDLIEIQ